MTTQAPRQIQDIEILHTDALYHLTNLTMTPFLSMSFIDPPFNQHKLYRQTSDNMDETQYWSWLALILKRINELTVDGGCVYFMNKEKALSKMIQTLEQTGWTIQNVIIWQKMSSVAAPLTTVRYRKTYQPIVFATKGNRPRVYNFIRIFSPSQPHYTLERSEWTLLGDVWSDIRELTSGFLAGDEPVRDALGNRLHLQQMPIHLILRCMLQSTVKGDTVLDPFCGVGTTAVASSQLMRKCIALDNDLINVRAAQERVAFPRAADSVERFRDLYRIEKDVSKIFPIMLPSGFS